MEKYNRNSPQLKDYRRELRKNGTPAEAALWNIIKGKKVAGLQFRRQYSIDNYILDFYCPGAKVAIELDGDYHNQVVVSEHDCIRDKELMDKYGIRTLRFENRDIFEHPEDVVHYIEERVIEQ